MSGYVTQKRLNNQRQALKKLEPQGKACSDWTETSIPMHNARIEGLKLKRKNMDEPLERMKQQYANMVRDSRSLDALIVTETEKLRSMQKQCPVIKKQIEAIKQRILDYENDLAQIQSRDTAFKAAVQQGPIGQAGSKISNYASVANKGIRSLPGRLSIQQMQQRNFDRQLGI